MKKLARFVAQYPSLDYVWITDIENLSTKGIGESIWLRGVNTSFPTQSILGHGNVCTLPPTSDDSKKGEPMAIIDNIRSELDDVYIVKNVTRKHDEARINYHIRDVIDRYIKPSSFNEQVEIFRQYFTRYGPIPGIDSLQSGTVRQEL